MVAGNDQDLPASQQMRGVKNARSIQTTCNGELSGRWVVQFGAGQIAAIRSIVLSGRK